MTPAVPVTSVTATAYTIPTEQPEADGTLAWDKHTLVVVEVSAGDRTGLGYTYADPGAASVVDGKLSGVVTAGDALDVGATWAAMVAQLRNLGQSGLGMMALSAVDTALWDLKAKVLDVPLTVALDAVHEAVPIYGSGGFCNYTLDELAEQLRGWVAAGIPRVKMKTGREPQADGRRLAAARDAIGEDVALFVDANGAFSRKQALAWAGRYADAGVTWLEEPVSSNDLEGLRLVRDRGPAGLDVAAGEYGWTPWYFRDMLAAGAVDCLQADVTRCGGFTGLRAVSALCDAHQIDLSAHCAPQLSAHGCAAVWHLRHLEYFHDHVRIEHLAFDGCLEPAEGGVLRPDREVAGHGLVLKRADLEQWRVA